MAKESWSPPAVERPRSSTRSPLRGGSWSDSARATSAIPRAHLSRDHHPVPPELTRYGRFVELWSAVSISLVLLIVVGSLVTGFLGPIASIILGLGVYIVIDAAFRRRLGVLILRTTILLAAVASVILFYTFATAVVIALIVGLAVFTLVDNVRDVSRG